MKDHIDIYLRQLTARNFSPRTIENYGGILYPLASFLKKQGKRIDEALKNDAREYVILLVDNNMSPISINQVLITLCSFYDWMCAHEYFNERNPFNEIKKQRVGKLLPVFCVEEEIRRLYTLVEKDNKIKVQDMTMFDCFFSTGIRTSELCNLKALDIILDGDTVFLRIREGKGKKDREVRMLKFGWEALQKHLAGIRLRGFKTDWIFPNQHGNKMLRQDVYKVMRRIISKVKNRKMGAHTIRHTFATYLMNNGTPLKGIQVQLGHESAAATQNYTHVDIMRKINIHQKAHPKG